MGFTTKNAISDVEGKIATSIDDWVGTYKNAYIQKMHDATQMDVVLPDDCLILAGPPRLSGSSTEVTPIGFVTSFSMQEQRQVQPMKAIGSYRHVFTATNSPVTLSFERLLIDGPNLMRSLYGEWTRSNTTEFKNEAFVESDWFMNLEDDIYRIPFGLGLVYYNPRTLSGADNSGNTMTSPGADYFEGCVVQSCSMSIQQGQTAIMENVQVLCDRRVPFTGRTRTTADNLVTSTPVGNQMYSYVSQALKTNWT